MNENSSEQDKEQQALQARLKKETPEQLLARLGEIVAPHEKKQREEAQYNAQIEENVKAGGALTLAMHPVSGVAVGGFIGYGLDTLFGTSPLLLALTIPLGLGAGFVNLVRALKDRE